MPRDWSKGRRKVEHEARCRVCGNLAQLEAAHIVPRSIGGEMDEDCFVPLCRTCHRRYDAHTLDLLPYLSYREQARAVETIGLERARTRLTGEAA